MSSIEEMKTKLETLPKGYISKKIINGKVRFYLQYREGSKIVSKYIKSKDIATVEAQLIERKTIEEEISRRLSNGVKLAKLGEHALSLTGDLMLFDKVIASFDEGVATYIDEHLVPLYIKRTRDLASWLESRSIDSHRTHSRLLRKALRLKDNNEIRSVISAYALTITDAYWFRPLKSNKHYDEIIFKDNLYSAVALDGNLLNIPSKPVITPELTNTGSYEKCWKMIDGEWWMYKKGNKDELFAELFSSRLAKLLSIPTAEYEIEDGYIKTKNIAKGYNLEPISSLAGDDDSYENVFPVVLSLGEEIAKQYLIFMWFDCLVNNVDRHNENLAFLRDQTTGRIISLAPNYDNNMAMFVSGRPKDMSNKRGMINAFHSFIKKNRHAAILYKSLELPVVNQEMITVANGGIENVNDVIEYVMSGFRVLKNFHNLL
ncbi:MAG: hypothetical protein MJ238_00085 [Bacilli bacterium]|nr:hypothetical protein [Bacilli bacterium]